MTNQYDNEKIIPQPFDDGTPEKAMADAIIRSLPDKTGKAGKCLKVSLNEKGCEWADDVDAKAVWGEITGTLSDQTDLNTAISGKQNALVVTSGTLTSAGWSESVQTLSVTGVTATNFVIVKPDYSSYSEYVGKGVYVSAQSDGSLTFTCGDTAPESDITVKILII